MAAQVINLDGQARISYRLEADLINNQSPLNMAEQQALASIYSQCAPRAGRAPSCRPQCVTGCAEHRRRHNAVCSHRSV